MDKELQQMVYYAGKDLGVSYGEIAVMIDYLEKKQYIKTKQDFFKIPESLLGSLKKLPILMAINIKKFDAKMQFCGCKTFDDYLTKVENGQVELMEQKFYNEQNDFVKSSCKGKRKLEFIE